eukprot:scaffold364905_cov15-Prasinocladus_malaysianus.AAC.1
MGFHGNRVPFQNLACQQLGCAVSKFQESPQDSYRCLDSPIMTTLAVLSRLRLANQMRTKIV